ncbi:UNVERIFIED_CONTAM: hypothetical protein HDU68_010702 [Siphonaria sp. JEL0065]|nr:hypothetical protein HDU68_010702 [Siphonaria sp. JEL0065]
MDSVDVPTPMEASAPPLEEVVELMETAAVAVDDGSVGPQQERRRRRWSQDEASAAWLTAALSSASSLAGSTTSTVTLVYVHGFLGSGESFHVLPGDVQRQLLSRGVRAVTVAYDYATTGDNDLRVAEFVAWLKDSKRAITGNVVLLGHSMGGLLCVDAARALAKLSSSELNFKVIKILAFDSPFLGVHPRAVVHSGGAKVVDKLNSFANMFGGSGGVASRSSSESLSARAVASTAITTPKASGSGMSWSTLATAGVAAATLAAAAYSSPTVRDSVSKAVSTHASFLGPLWSPGDQEARLQWLLSQQTIQFTCFYLVTTMNSSSQENTISRNTFISTPAPTADYARLFKPIQYDATRNPKGKECGDEIEAHMNMFRGGVIGDSVYNEVLANTVTLL